MTVREVVPGQEFIVVDRAGARIKYIVCSEHFGHQPHGMLDLAANIVPRPSCKWNSISNAINRQPPERVR